MKNILYKLTLMALALFVSCTDEVEFKSDTEALNNFTIVESENQAYVLNSGTPDNTIELNWNAAKPGVSKVPTYQVVFFDAEDENTELFRFTSDNEGALNMLTLTFDTLDQALSNAGYDVGAVANLKWQVVATNGDVEVATGKTNISVTRYSSNGIEAFSLLTPENNNVITVDLYGDPTGEVSFSWEEAATTTGSGDIEYTILFDEIDGDFSSPISSFSTGSDTSFTFTNEEIGEVFADNINIIWTVKANIVDDTTELTAEKQYINWDIFIINELYLVGSHNGWDNATANAFTNNGNGNFKLQIDLEADDQFKFLPTLGSWDGDWGEDPANPGKLIQDGEQNLTVTEAGTYIITVDFPTLTIVVQQFNAPDNLYMVGSINGWNNATAIPLYNDYNGVFSTTYTFSAGDQFKFLPVQGSWDGDWGEDPDNAGALIQDGEQNITISEAGTYSVIVNFNSLTVHVSPINSLFAVGSHNGWNNADSTQEFNTSGNGVFTKLLTFIAGDQFKFLPTSGSWDGDWGENPDNLGTLIQDGEQNININADGSYMVTVDFNTLTYNVTEAPSNLFLVGSLNGWDNTTAPQFTNVSEGIFEITQTLTSSDEFKFLSESGSWSNDWGQSSTYPGMLLRENESNIKSPGDGTYTITVNFNTGLITVE